MNYEFIPDAEIELERAIYYFKIYGKDGSFMNDLANQLRLIALMPFAFQIKYKGIRIVNFADFDYSIHYIVENDSIYILRIINQTQHF